MSDTGQVVVLAGGRATRLGERARSVPKFLMPVAGRPFAAWVLDRLHACGFRDVVLCVGHLGDAIRQALGDGRSFDLQVRYADDGPHLLGTAGALRNAAPLLAPRFVVTYGDSYLPFDYGAVLRDLHEHTDALGTLAVYRNEDRYDRSNVRVAGDWVIEYRKGSRTDPPDPTLRDIDYGAMALCREVVLGIEPARPSELDRVQAALARRRKLRALRIERRFYEIGSEEGLAALEAELTAHPDDHPNRRAPSPASRTSS